MYVADAAALEGLASSLRSTARIAFDVEFMREKTYHARLCLIQVAADGVEAVVDPLGVEDLGPLYEVLNDTRILKVVHAGSQDLEIVFQKTGRVPSPVFDTQVAATVAGFPLQASYGSLVGDVLGVTLPKAHRFSDWCARPLSEGQLEYALDDVRYLLPLHDALTGRLEAEGRSEWLKPELDALVDPEAYRMDAMSQYARVKGHSTLDRRALGVLMHTAAWRENEAARRDLPRKWVISDESLIEIARRKPADLAALNAVRGVGGKVREREAKGLLAAVAAGAAMPAEELPAAPRKRGPGPEAAPVLDAMNALLRIRARQHGVAAPSLGTRDDLEALAAGERSDSQLLTGWRRGLVGEDLIALLEGKLVLMVRHGALVAVPREEV